MVRDVGGLLSNWGFGSAEAMRLGHNDLKFRHHFNSGVVAASKVREHRMHSPRCRLFHLPFLLCSLDSMWKVHRDPFLCRRLPESSTFLFNTPSFPSSTCGVASAPMIFKSFVIHLLIFHFPGLVACQVYLCILGTAEHP